MARATTQREADRGQRLQIAPVVLDIPGASPVCDRYKRAFDLSVIIAVHILFSPVALLLWTLVPLAIWLEDRGPVFYAQRRVGRHGRVFRLYKFRSMVKNAESETGPVWSSEEDPRITRVGRFLRTRALDELPQVINVFKGEMSLVGPRPERPEFVDQFSQDTPMFIRRLQVKPGLTGLAQVRGCYFSRPREKLRYDALYIRKMSPWVDIRILGLSVLVSVRAKWQAADKRLRASSKSHAT